MRFLKLSILVSVLFFGMAFAQETPKPMPVKPAEDVKIVLNYVDKEAVFPEGGVNGFRNLLASKVDTDKINEYENLPKEEVKKIKKLISQKKPTPEILISSTLIFAIEPDGTMSDISAKGKNQSFNEEIERAVKSIQTKWIPAQRGKENVKSYMRVPMRIAF